MDFSDTEALDDVSTYWAGSHVVIAVLVLGLSLAQSVEVALYASALLFVALAFEYVLGPIRVVRVRE